MCYLTWIFLLSMTSLFYFITNNLKSILFVFLFFFQMRDIRNKIMHSATLEVTDAELQQYIGDMIHILNDSKTIQNLSRQKTSVQILYIIHWKTEKRFNVWCRLVPYERVSNLVSYVLSHAGFGSANLLFA